MSLYKNQIREMDESELLELLRVNDWTLRDADYVDADEVIEIMELEQGTVYESAEDDVLDTIMNGNWTYAVEQMLDLSIYPDSLIDYIQDYRFEVYDEAYEWFTLESAVAITELFYKTRKVA